MDKGEDWLAEPALWTENWLGAKEGLGLRVWGLGLGVGFRV